MLGLLKVVFPCSLSVVGSNFLVCSQTKQRQDRVFANRDCQRSLLTRVLRATGALQELVNSLTGQVADNANFCYSVGVQAGKFAVCSLKVSAPAAVRLSP